jgi:2-keto-3-deoxy-6-phosphogluconate aldolase
MVAGASETDIASIAALAPVIPVLTIERAVDAVPQVTEATAGVGTVLAFEQALQAESRFAANVACVGGSWVAPKAAVGRRDWPWWSVLARRLPR